MSYHYQGGAGFYYTLHYGENLNTGSVVKGCRRLVGQNKLRLLHQSTCYGYTLLLTSRKLGRIVGLSFRKAYKFKCL